MKHVKIFEEFFNKFDMMDFDGVRPFKIDKDNGKLYRTSESHGEYFLTQDEYLDLEGLNDVIPRKIKLLEEQKKTTIDIFRLAIAKIVKDRPMKDTSKKI